MSFWLPFQSAIVRDASRLILIEKARQIGVTMTLAQKLVLEHAEVGCRFDAWVSSRDELQAKLFIQDCNEFAGAAGIALESLGEQVIDPVRNISAFVTALANGKRIHSLSSNPDGQAGKRGTRLFDEFPINKDNRQLYDIGYPGITWGGSMILCGTHRGSQNFFNQLVREIVEKGNPKGFSHHKVTLQNALDQGFLAKLKAKLPASDPRIAMDDAEYFDFIKNGCADNESFLQEFCCVPDDDASSFIPWDWIIAAEYPRNMGDGWQTGLDACGELFVGYDFARSERGDFSVIVVLERIGDVLHTRRLFEMKGVGFDEQRNRLYSLLEMPNVRRACIDNGGPGTEMAEKAARRYPKVESFGFTNASKESLAYPLKTVFENRHIRIPEAAALRADIRSVRKEYTTSANVRFAGDRTTNGHADRFWAYALAVHAAGKPSGWVAAPVLIGESRITNFNDGWQNSISL